MNFRFSGLFLIALALPFFFACSDKEKETPLVNQIITASQDIIAINFPDDTETTLSIGSEYTFKLQGLKSNGVDIVDINQDIRWSLSVDAKSTIDKNGKLTAANTVEYITLTAQLGILITSIDIHISAAKFDRVVALHDADISIEMCQTKNITPIGRYIDENGNAEIRPVDSTVIDTIEWNLLDDQNNPSHSAYIKVIDKQTTLTSLEAANIKITATAISQNNGNNITSEVFDLSIGSGLSLLKICNANENNLSNCSLGNIDLEGNTRYPVIAVGRYVNADGSNQNINITAATKWGADNPDIITLSLSSNSQQLEISGNITNSSTSLALACGTIRQSMETVDISQGILLNEAPSCTADDPGCLQASITVNVNGLQITALEVSANNIDLNHNQLLTLSSRPSEISLQVNGNFSDGSRQNLTDDTDLSYLLIATQPAVIEAVDGSNGVYRVLAAGTAEIQLQYQGTIFIALIKIP